MVVAKRTLAFIFLQVYQGRQPFSEVESRAVRDQVNGRLKGQLDAFITMHTYSQIWIHPYGHERNEYPADRDELVNDIYRRSLCHHNHSPEFYAKKFHTHDQRMLAMIKEHVKREYTECPKSNTDHFSLF